MILINDKPIKSSIFPGGEVHVELPFQDPKIVITRVLSHIRSSNDVMELMLVMNALLEQGIKGGDIQLLIPYFPYARQDRVCGFGQAASLIVLTDLINSLKCREVTVYDPHSERLVKLLDNMRTIAQYELFLYGNNGELVTLIEKEKLVIVCPDKGAISKIEYLKCTKSHKLLLKRSVDTEYFYCSKKRDLQTGNIIESIVPEALIRKNFIIVDDICDGGRTFIEIAKKADPGPVHKKRYLYVTHGIFSQGLDYLKPYFEHVFCITCFLPEETIASETDFLTVMDYEI